MSLDKLNDELPLHNFFNQKLIDCLPGIFYLYKIEEHGQTLKAWNRNHMTVTGYSEKECKDKPPKFFIDKASIPAISQAIKQIESTGKVQNVYGNLRTKKGEILPYIFEGYKFEIGHKSYFMGVGIDASNLVSLKEQLKLLTLEKERAVQERKEKENQLISIAMEGSNKDKLLQDGYKRLTKLLEINDLQSIHFQLKQHIETIRLQSKFQDNWDLFRIQFNSVHDQFFQRLREEHAVLTSGELRFCAYIKVHLSPSQLCSLLNISKNGLKKKRYRIKKKLGLGLDENLDSYISNF